VRKSVAAVALVGVLVLIASVTILAWTDSESSADDAPDPTARRAPQALNASQAPTEQNGSVLIGEGFEAGVVPPSGWTHVQTHITQTWKVGIGSPHSGSRFADVQYVDANQDELLISPSFTTTWGAVSLWSFGSLEWCRDGSDNCDLEIWLVKGSWGGGDDVQLGLADDDWTSTWTWSRSSFAFNALGQPARVALRYVGRNGAQVGVDDITVSVGTRLHLPLAFVNLCAAGTLVPDDTLYGQQWGLDRINVSRWWSCGDSGSQDVVVAVVDTGVDLEHPEFAGKLVPGRDFANDDNRADDDHGHGTHVAGIVGALGNNGSGIAGLAWNTSIMPLKTLDANGSGPVSDSIEAVVWAADHGADIINMSLGSRWYNRAFQDAVSYAHNKGALVVASAGNCGDANFDVNGCIYEDQPHYPGAYNSVTAVASTTSADTQSSFSTQGYYVDIAAPGSNILSTDMGGGYRYLSGTSQAAPHVAGLAALIKAAHPSHTPSQIVTTIQSTAVDLGAAGRDNQYGWGRIDAGAAFDALLGASVSEDLAPTTVQLLSRDDGAEITPGVVLAKFRSGVSVQANAGLLADLANVNIHVTASVPQTDLLVLAVPPGSEWDVIESLRASPLLEYAEPDLVLRIH
jgi:hypothetical protein